jgi:2'-5' RNA ligase
MRPFIALGFDEKTKQKIYDKMLSLDDSYTAQRKNTKEMLHITLHFFGDCPEFDFNSAKMLCDYITKYSMSFNLKTDIPKIFGTLDDAVLYLSLGKGTKRLEGLQAFVQGSLPLFGFDKENHEYHPHITFAREANIPDMADIVHTAKQSKDISFKAQNIVLLDSRIVDGKPAYAELYKKKLVNKSLI